MFTATPRLSGGACNKHLHDPGENEALCDLAAGVADEVTRGWDTA
jgi:hypothetical protein